MIAEKRISDIIWEVEMDMEQSMTTASNLAFSFSQPHSPDEEASSTGLPSAEKTKSGKAQSAVTKEETMVECLEVMRTPAPSPLPQKQALQLKTLKSLYDWTADGE